MLVPGARPRLLDLRELHGGALPAVGPPLEAEGDRTGPLAVADVGAGLGDVGSQDGDGYFRITDRMKDIIITAGGKNITPSELENELKFSPYITDAVVIGDRRPYLSAIVMIDQENV